MDGNEAVSTLPKKKVSIYAVKEDFTKKAQNTTGKTKIKVKGMGNHEKASEKRAYPPRKALAENWKFDETFDSRNDTVGYNTTSLGETMLHMPRMSVKNGSGE